MKSNELRLGNLLVYPNWHKDGKDKIWKVRDIFREENRIGLTDEILQTSTRLKYLKPIPLSEEILLKCGFEKSIELMSIKVDFEYIFLLKISKSGTVYIKQGHDEVVIKSNVIYLHQLQNLYFALTGSGLETSNLS